MSIAEAFAEWGREKTEAEEARDKARGKGSWLRSVRGDKGDLLADLEIELTEDDIGA
jgi:hypothetical protein